MAVQNASNGLDTRGVVNSELSMCDNITDTAIRITESKARLVYRDHLKHSSGERVVSAFGLFIAFLTTLLTSNFNDIAGIENSKYVMNALYVLLAIVSGIATIVFFFQWIQRRKNNNEDTFINALKGYDIS